MPRSLRRHSVFAAASLITVAACSGSGVGPATTPATVVTTSTSSAPATTTTRTPVASPITATTLDRVTEIEAIVRDLEERRLRALYEGDEGALRPLYANDVLFQREREAIASIGWDEIPTVDISVEEVVAHTEDCLVVRAVFDYRASLGPEVVSLVTVTYQPAAAGWGFSFRAADKEAWLCNSPHPLETVG